MGTYPVRQVLFFRTFTETGEIQRIRITRDEKHTEEGVGSITTNEEFQRDTEKLFKIGGLHTDKCTIRGSDSPQSFATSNH